MSLHVHIRGKIALADARRLAGHLAKYPGPLDIGTCIQGPAGKLFRVAEVRREWGEAQHPRKDKGPGGGQFAKGAGGGGAAVGAGSGKGA